MNFYIILHLPDLFIFPSRSRIDFKLPPDGDFPNVKQTPSAPHRDWWPSHHDSTSIGKHLLIASLLQPTPALRPLPEIRIARRKATVCRLVALQPLMTIAIHRVGPVHHFLAQEI